MSLFDEFESKKKKGFKRIYDKIKFSILGNPFLNKIKSKTFMSIPLSLIILIALTLVSVIALQYVYIENTHLIEVNNPSPSPSPSPTPEKVVSITLYDLSMNKINFQSNIDWGSGYESNSMNSKAFIVKNTGNVDVSLDCSFPDGLPSGFNATTSIDPLMVLQPNETLTIDIWIGINESVNDGQYSLKILIDPIES